MPNFLADPQNANALIPAKSSTWTLADVIARVESNNNKYALRFEPGWKVGQQLVVQVATINKCDVVTSMTVCKTSFGAYQVMGSNLYYLGLTQPIGAFLNDTALQQLFFIAFLQSRNIDFELDDVLDNEEKDRLFALHYNGNPAAYLVAIRDTFDRMQEQSAV